MFQLLQVLWPVCLFHIFSLQLMLSMLCWPLMQNNIFVTLVLSLLKQHCQNHYCFYLHHFPLRCSFCSVSLCILLLVL